MIEFPGQRVEGTKDAGYKNRGDCEYWAMTVQKSTVVK